MYRIVILDDEKLVLYGIKAYITEHTDQFIVIGTFSRAEEALEFCRKEQPDIILTDIKMPGMNGLTFIEKIRTLLPSTRIIVLSCHDDFPLVRKSFTLGANEYILKHEIEETELVTVLEKVAASMADRRSALPVRTKTFEIAELLKTPRDELSENFPHLKEDYYLICSIGFKHAYDEEELQIPWKPDLQILSTIIDEYLEKSMRGEVFTESPDRLFIFIPFPENVKPSRNDSLLQFLETLTRKISRYVNRNIYIGIAEKAVALSSMERGYTSAVHVLDCSFYYKSSAFLFADAMGKKCPSEEEKEDLPLSLSPSQPLSEWESECRSYFDRCGKKPERNPGKVKGEVSFAFQELDHKTRTLFAISLENIIDNGNTHYIERISSFDDIDAMRRWVLSSITTIWEEFDKIRDASKSAALIKQYIDEHFTETITLSDTAAHFNMNMNYLSQLFKKETKINFIEYINKKRIEKAKEFIFATDLPVKQICFKVGYNNPNYFSRIFKRICGITVSEFRDRIHGIHS